jgi:tetratricopeptide (TPR) repeat protein
MSENQLIKKGYYELFLSENEIAHPIRVLGEAYMKEQKNELSNLSTIRFAQGELYFHHQDFETAIFKWENINNELEPWAKKNMADAYFKLELYKTAEDVYKSITTDSVILNTEIGLQLFSLYIEQGNLESAFKVIKKVVHLNPDYPNVTEIARDFFEEQQDWKSAVELVAGEAIRTKFLHWFDFLHEYIEKGYTKKVEPSYFSKVIKVLFSVDQNRFENMIINVTNSYRNEESYFLWVKTMNQIFLNLEIETRYSFQKISQLFKETYFELLNGNYLISKLHEVVPELLMNWITFTRSTMASAAVLAWNELFPSSLMTAVVNEAEHRFHHSKNHQISLNEVTQLIDSILKWAKGLDIEIGYDLENVTQDSAYRNPAEQVENLVNLIRKAIAELLEKRVEVEGSLNESIKFTEDMLLKLNGTTHQLEDLEQEKTKSIKNYYAEQKERMKSDLQTNIPKLLKSCSEIISEESDFAKIHHVLNEEMNNRIQGHLQNKVLPEYYHSFQDWIVFSESELRKSQSFLNERSEGLNRLFGEVKLKLDCDFKLLDDWQRDANRLTSGVTIENVNILLKFTPAQFLLKSAGKLFGTISQNKSILYSKYKSFVENETYEEVTNIIITKFLLQFDLFEKALERDLKVFFKNPFLILNETVIETRDLKRVNEESLKKLKENPEVFQDPLTLFELRLRQYEWMMVVGNNPKLII